MISKSKNESEQRLAIAVGNNTKIKLLSVPSYKPGNRPTIWRYHSSGNSAVVGFMDMCGFSSEHDLRHDGQQYRTCHCSLHYPTAKPWSSFTVVCMPSSRRRAY